MEAENKRLADLLADEILNNSVPVQGEIRIAPDVPDGFQEVFDDEKE